MSHRPSRSTPKRDVPPIPIRRDGLEPPAPAKTGRSSGRLVPWLLGVCLLCFLGFAAIGAVDVLTGGRGLARATPTPAFLAGAEVILAGPDGASVTVWQVGGACEVGVAFGQVPAGTGAQVLAEGCYSHERRAYFHRIALANGSQGWVASGDMVLAAAYAPPTPSETPMPRTTPTPWPTRPPAQAAGPTADLAPLSTTEPLPPGSSLYAGSWGVRVDRVAFLDAVSTPAGDKSVTAAGQYALIYLTATNRGSRYATLHVSRLYVEDAGGNRYGNDDTASAYASSAGCFDFALDVAPGESVCLVAAIDLPEGGGPYVLRLDRTTDSVRLDVP